MPVTKDDIVSVITNHTREQKQKNSPVDSCIVSIVEDLVVYIENEAGIVEILVEFDSPQELGLASIGELLFKLAETLMPDDSIETIDTKCLHVLRLLKRAAEREATRTKVKVDKSRARLVNLHKEMFKENIPHTLLDGELKLLLAHAIDAAKFHEELKILVVNWLWEKKHYVESTEIAESIPSNNCYYDDAQYTVGVFYTKHVERILGYTAHNKALDALLRVSETFLLENKVIQEHIQELIDVCKQEIKGKGYHGFYVVDHFELWRGAKTKEKECIIDDPDYAKTGLKLHERQSLVERVVDLDGDEKLTALRSVDPYYNYLVVNIGFIVTDRVWVKGGDHSRGFLTIPLVIENLTRNAESPHTEPTFFKYITNQTNLDRVISEFRVRYGIKAVGHKVYGIVFDFHSSYDMCNPCFDKTNSFFKKFRPFLLSALERNHFKLPHNREKNIFQHYDTEKSLIPEDGQEIADNCHFNIIVRFSSESDHSKGVRRGKEVFTEERDIRYSDRHLFFHGSSAWHSLWRTPSKMPKASAPEIPLENWTAISTSGGVNQGEEPFNYTRLGIFDFRRYKLWVDPPAPVAQVVLPISQMSGLAIVP